jgi:hypothetical protein
LYKKNREETDKNLGKFEQAFNYLKLKKIECFKYNYSLEEEV